MDDREAAWWAVHDALEHLPGWKVTPSAFHAEETPWPRWHVTAVDLGCRGRGLRHEALEGTGDTEVEALAALRGMLQTRGAILRRVLTAKGAHAPARGRPPRDARSLP